MKEKSDSWTRWASGTSDDSLGRATRDRAALERARLRLPAEESRPVLGGPLESQCRQLRGERSMLDYAEWNAAAGFSGLRRAPDVPGVTGAARRAPTGRAVERDEGF